MNLFRKIFPILVIISFFVIPGAAIKAQTVPATQLPTGTLVHAAGDGTVYYIENSAKRPIDSAEAFRVQGFQWVIREISPKDLAVYPTGQIITKNSVLEFPGQADVAPDIAPFAPNDLRLVNRNGRMLILFTTKFWNMGKGPLELDATTTKPTPDNIYETAQRIALPNGSVRNKVVGNFLWHEAHKHFHYDDFASYVLEMIPAQEQAPTFTTPPASGATPPPPVWVPGLQPSMPGSSQNPRLMPASAGTDLPGGLKPISSILGASTVAPLIVNKTTFCIYENEHILLPTEGPGKAKKTYTICGKFRQGISVGWADVYPYTLPDQNFDVTDLPAGIYRLAFVLDPHMNLMERDLGNNIGVAFIDLNPQAGTMSILASGSPFYTPLNNFPDGMLVRSESGSTIYVMQNNKKQLLSAPPTGQVFILPQGVFDAIPALNLIRATGSPTIYILNEKGFRRGITSMNVFSSYGLKLQDTTEISQSDLFKYPETDLIEKQGDNKVYSISTHKSVGTIDSLSGLRLDPSSVHIVNQTDFESYMTDVVATGLFVPWDIAFLPGGDMLVPERSGTLRQIGKNPVVISVPGVLSTGEGGLMGLTLSPTFAADSLIYLYFTTSDNGQKNRVASFMLNGNQLTNEKIIIDNIPSKLYHDGGRIAFGPDGMLYVTTGDASSPNSAQDLGSLAGKTLRIMPDGRIPADNPFGTAVFSYGHRNSEGIAWDSLGRMWETEHGPTQGSAGEPGLCCRDEINLVEKGKNYGWPVITADQNRDGMVTPMLNSGANETWAPAGIAFASGSLYFAGLKGSTLYQVRFNSDGSFKDLRTHFAGQFGRLRAVVAGPDGSLYLSTSNRDGRGTAFADDDKIIRVYPGFLQSTQ